MRNTLLFILTFSILLTGFDQVFDILSFRVQKCYVSNDHQAFVKSNIIYCGGKNVLKKKLNDHEKSSGSTTEGRREILLFRQHNMMAIIFVVSPGEDLFVPFRTGNIIRRPSSIFHPPRC